MSKNAQRYDVEGVMTEFIIRFLGAQRVSKSLQFFSRDAVNDDLRIGSDEADVG